MLLRPIYPKRWFIWTIVLTLAIGIGLAGYLQWVNIQIDTENTLTYVDMSSR